MNKYAIKTIALLAMLTFAACTSDDDPPVKSNTNKNRNERLVEATNASSPSEALKAAQRMEMPALKGGNNWFLVYVSKEIGVNFCVEWSIDKRAQYWSAYQMTTTTNQKNWNRNNWIGQINNNEWARLCFEQTKHYKNPYADPFQPELALPVDGRTELEDYKGSGYSRGHVCPSADRLSSMLANEQTFKLTNIMPMSSGFNTGTWEMMETRVRKWSPSSKTDTLYVCKGGTIDNGKYTTANNLTVPRYYFMAIMEKNSKSGNGGYKAVGFWIEHKNENQGSDLSKFAMSIDELEAKTGIDFFCNLPDDIESQVEANYVPNVWGL